MNFLSEKLKIKKKKNKYSIIIIIINITLLTFPSLLFPFSMFVMIGAGGGGECDYTSSQSIISKQSRASGSKVKRPYILGNNDGSWIVRVFLVYLV